MRFVRVQLDRVVIVGILLPFCTNLLIIKKLNWKLFQQMLLKHLYHKTWHIPTGPKLHGDKAENIVVQGYDRENPQRATKGIKSTLYNPISGEESLNICSLVDQMKDMDILFSTVAMENDTDLVQAQF